ncbi:MAG TPA: PhzF family phenazine biosynthesis protein [Candidatus Thermoplasmatota archaeon]|jgi:trans-2,3-dihydro-3-hydroxyanthranilate isomerase|nr:PhzF family phenazine biosynthesis protein [Candidatus Thermoplasmatota archaeon]
MKKLLVKKVDAFTDAPLAGNPAGVVHGADTLSDREMQGLAREMNLSETAFILSPEDAGIDFELRYFTPTEEVELGGHATLASYHSLVEEKVLKLGAASNKFNHKNKSGIYGVEVRPRGAFEQIMMQMDKPSFGEDFDDDEKIAKLLGIEKKQLHDELPAKTMNEKTLLVPVDGLATLEKLDPDFTAIAKLKRKEKIEHLLPFTKETHDMGSNYHMRFFAPAIGINEDPVTGVGHARLAAYLVRHKVVKTTSGLASLTGEQGHFVGRPGKVTVEVRSEGQTIRDVRVGGTAMTVLRGEVLLP